MAAHHLHVLDFDFDCSCHAAEAEPVEPVAEDGPRGVPFGEFLVGQRVIERHQLLRALQLQDDHPGRRLGECLADLGAIAQSEIQDHLGSFIRFLAVLPV